MSSDEIPTRDRILKSTLRLLEAGGASAVRMSDIAKETGISRQALYLHFPSRADLLIAATRYLDEVHASDERLLASRTAATGRERLAAWIDAWGNYIPEVYGVANALFAIKDSDPDALAAWEDRMEAVRHGCAAAITALKRDGALIETLDETTATDILWSLLSISLWERLRKDCGWSQAAYVAFMHEMTVKALVKVGE